MTSVRLTLQAVAVLSMVTFVSWSDYSRVAGAADAAARAAARQSSASGEPSQRGSSQDLRSEVGYGSMSMRRASTAASTGAAALQQRLYEQTIRTRRESLPVALMTLGGRVNGIIGQARTTMNAPVPFARLVLRDPVTGRIEARAIADDKGQFTFLDIMPSGYVIEVIGPEDKVFATSDVVTVGLGELREAMVYLADTREALGTFGTLIPTANEPIAAARESGIAAVTPPDHTVSPQR